MGGLFCRHRRSSSEASSQTEEVEEDWDVVSDCAASDCTSLPSSSTSPPTQSPVLDPSGNVVRVDVHRCGSCCNHIDLRFYCLALCPGNDDKVGIHYGYKQAGSPAHPVWDHILSYLRGNTLFGSGATLRRAQSLWDALRIWNDFRVAHNLGLARPRVFHYRCTVCGR